MRRQIAKVFKTWLDGYKQQNPNADLSKFAGASDYAREATKQLTINTEADLRHSGSSENDSERFGDNKSTDQRGGETRSDRGYVDEGLSGTESKGASDLTKQRRTVIPAENTGEIEKGSRTEILNAGARQEFEKHESHSQEINQPILSVGDSFTLPGSAIVLKGKGLAGQELTQEEVWRLTDTDTDSLLTEAAATLYQIRETGLEVAPVHIAVLRRAEGTDTIERGIKLTLEEAKLFWKELEELGDYYPAYKKWLKNFADDLVRKAELDGGGVAVFTDGTVMYQEVHHLASQVGSNNAPLEERVNVKEGIEREEYKIAASFLRGMGYPDNPAELIEEIAAHINEGLRKDIGLTEEEAASFLNWWYNSYRAKGHNLNHPKFDEAAYYGKEILEDVRRKGQTDSYNSRKKGGKKKGNSRGL